MDVIDVLTGDHNQMRGLFARYEGADESNDAAASREFANAIFDVLERHMKAEETAFYGLFARRRGEPTDR